MTPSAPILVFGKTGQVARELQALLPDAVFLGRDGADLSDPQACHDVIITHRPQAVINAAAWTGVDQAEADEAAATRVNGASPGAMATACAALNIPFIHISTDYVFDGAGVSPFSPSDATAPLGAYGRSKLAGEQAVRAAGGQHLILRTSWVFSAHGHNFVKTMLRLGAERDSLNVVADQIGGPTPAKDIAQTLIRLLAALQNGHPGGIYHFSGAPDLSWADFARAIMAEAELACTISDIATSQYPTPAKRPANSRLACQDLATDFGIERPDWRAELHAIVKKLSR